MAKDVYEQLVKHLDSLPAGFPRTESGVEMRILRRLFTPKDAELAVHLTLIPEEPRVIARRAGIPVAEVACRLEEMDRRGLIIRTRREDKPSLYEAAQYAVGFWEGQVNRLSPELVQDAQEYKPTFVNLDLWRKAPQFRTIPVNRSIGVQNEIMPYEMAEELMRAHKSFAVSNCICRQGTKRCQMQAIHVADKKAVFDVDRCIGCGLCVSTCPTHSLALVRKPQAEQSDIPKDYIKSAIKVARARGRLGIGEMLTMQVRSKLDRILAPK